MTVKYGQAEPTDISSVHLTIRAITDRLECAVRGFDNGENGPAFSVVDEVLECLKVLQQDIHTLCREYKVHIVEGLQATLLEMCQGLVDRHGDSDINYSIQTYVNAAVWEALQRNKSPQKMMDLYYQVWDQCGFGASRIMVQSLPESKGKRNPSNG